jgi:ABC-type sugar transport system substrate-binding protein
MDRSISLARGRAFSRLPGELSLAAPRDLLLQVSRKFVVLSFDTLPQQLQVLKDGYLTALIGQRPFKMGVQSIVSLKEATEGEKIENVDTGVGVVDASNVDQFLKK